MKVTKRNGTTEVVAFDKITRRLKQLGKGLRNVDVGKIVALTASNMFDGITTQRLDELTADTSVSFSGDHPEYGELAARITIANLHKLTGDDVLKTFEAMATVASPGFLAHVRAHAAELQAMVDYERDFKFDYFGIRTMEKIYCTKVGGRIVERPQHVYLRVAVALWGGDVDRVRQTYELLSTHAFTHASPTLFNAGTLQQQLASCYLMESEDSLDGIFGAMHTAARISKLGGGIGMDISAIRSKGAPITSTNGTSDGIIPMLKVANSVVSYVNQSGKRKGSMACYLSPDHPDLLDFLELRRPGGDEAMRCRDLFMALWVPDIFMRRVETGGVWSFFDPFAYPKLRNAHGRAYDAMYEEYEAAGGAVRSMPARDVWEVIVRAQIESGVPYLLFKDACNSKSNQQNLGTIHCSNLCVAPETTVLTRSGMLRIDTLCDSEVEVWNGEVWSKVTVRQTNDHAELMRITFSDGATLECTLYHAFYVRHAPRTPEASGVITKEAQYMEPGDVLLEWKYPWPATAWSDEVEAYGASFRRMTSQVPTIKVTVVSTERTGRHDKTYCFNEPHRHMGVFNGVLTGNCSEIIEFTSPEETAVCTLASISLPAFVTAAGGAYDFDGLHRTTKVAARNLDRIIDINECPVESAALSNARHRPIGIGVQGLSDVFMKLHLPFESDEAAELNRKIFATIYHAALEASTELAEEFGAYSSFAGSPAAAGKLQYDLWSVDPHPDLDWAGLKARIAAWGLRNSLSVAVMPTASTSQLLGNIESIEPVTSLYYVRRTLAGEFTCINKHLQQDMLARKLWTPEVKQSIITHGGSIQQLLHIPVAIRECYKTAWEIRQRVVIDQSADRGAYVCQSQSLNLFIAEPTMSKLSSMHFHAWKRGLKTGVYYLRTKPAARPTQITVVQPEPECISCSS